MSSSYEWTDALLRTLLLPNDDVLFMVLSDGGNVVGIIPLVIRKMKRYGLSVMHVFPIDGIYNIHSDILLNNLNEDSIKAIMAALFSLDHKWDVFTIRRFVETHPLLVQLERVLKNTACEYAVQRESPSFFIRLGNSYDEYLGQRSYNFRKDLHKKIKRIQKLGSVKFVNHFFYDKLTDVFEQLFSIEKRCWKYKHGTAIASIEKQSQFYWKLCENAYKNGWLHISFLLLNKQPIAYNLGLLKNGKYSYLKTSYDDAYNNVSPSTILRNQLIKDFISQGIEEIDFHGEPYAWQRQWTDELRWHKSLVIYNRTTTAKIYSIYKKIKNRKKDPNDRTVQFRSPEDTVACSTIIGDR